VHQRRADPQGGDADLARRLRQAVALAVLDDVVDRLAGGEGVGGHAVLLFQVHGAPVNGNKTFFGL